MKIAYGVTWGERKRPRLSVAWTVMVLFALLMSSMSVPQRERMAAEAARLIGVIVRYEPGQAEAAKTAVEDAGGRVGNDLGIIGGFTAEVPDGAIRTISSSRSVFSITPDGSVQLLGLWDDDDPLELDDDLLSPEGESGVLGLGESEQLGLLSRISDAIGATNAWKYGLTGRGVDVAMIDTGVVPVDGLTYPGKVINGPDLSFEGSFPEVRYMDTYGHGTHMAGIIAGRDADADPSRGRWYNRDKFMGVAPDARIVNVKVANNEGATDVSQVIAAIDWVVQHRRDPGMNIRVLNLSFGTDGVQDYQLDPLTYAAEVAWRKGIVVVVAAGNGGFGNQKLNNPAYDPHVIAVGASDNMGTASTRDDTIPEWSSWGDGVRNPDFAVPGKSVISLRAPGSMIDELYPQAVVAERFFKGSGTSQAAAAMSGAAALIIQQRPDITPDQLKRLFVKTADTLPNANAQAQGNGVIDLAEAATTRTPSHWESRQPYPYATGTGSLEASRGSVHVADENGNELTGEQDIFGSPWDGRTWSSDSWNGRTWSGGTWNGNTWSGDSWNGQSWAGRTWSGNTWSGRTWSGNTWSGRTWSGRTWSGRTWSGRTWSGRTWSGVTWSGRTWSGRTWSGRTWSSASWE